MVESAILQAFKNQQRNQSGTGADDIYYPSLSNQTIKHFLLSSSVDWLKQLLLLLRWNKRLCVASDHQLKRWWPFPSKKTASQINVAPRIAISAGTLL